MSSFALAADRGSVTVADVLHAVPGGERDTAIMQWAASVWTAWEREHAGVPHAHRPVRKTMIPHGAGFRPICLELLELVVQSNFDAA
jgi:hypothetical protein